MRSAASEEEPSRERNRGDKKGTVYIAVQRQSDIMTAASELCRSLVVVDEGCGSLDQNN